MVKNELERFLASGKPVVIVVGNTSYKDVQTRNALKENNFDWEKDIRAWMFGTISTYSDLNREWIKKTYSAITKYNTNHGKGLKIKILYDEDFERMKSQKISFK